MGADSTTPRSDGQGSAQSSASDERKDSDSESFVCTCPEAEIPDQEPDREELEL